MAGGGWRGRRDWLHDASSAARPAKERALLFSTVRPLRNGATRSSFRSAGLERDASVA